MDPPLMMISFVGRVSDGGLPPKFIKDASVQIESVVSGAKNQSFQGQRINRFGGKPPSLTRFVCYLHKRKNKIENSSETEYIALYG
jgi:hypothetical protein